MPATQYNAGFTDAESVNNSKRSNFLYKDLNLNCSRNPVTADVACVTDVQDIKRAVRNLVFLNPGEKPFHPEIGTGIRSMLFELVTPPVIQTMRNRIKFVLDKYEPRVTVTNISFDDADFQDMDNNTINCRIEFYLNNVPSKLEEVDVLLKRVR